MIKLKQLEKELKVKADAMGLRAAVNYTPLTGQASYSLSSKMRDRPFAFPRLVNRLGIPMSRLHEFKVSSTTKEAPVLSDPAAQEIQAPSQMLVSGNKCPSTDSNPRLQSQTTARSTVIGSKNNVHASYD